MYNQKENLLIWKLYKHTISKEITKYSFDKHYIGITSRENPNDRWKDGFGYYGQIFYSAIKKYGWDNFTHEILKENMSLSEALIAEQEAIKEYDSLVGHKGYNLSPGGDYVPRNNEPIIIFEKNIVVPSIYHCEDITGESLNHIHYMCSKIWNLSSISTDNWFHHYIKLKYLYKYMNRKQSSSMPIVYLKTGELFPSVNYANNHLQVWHKSKDTLSLDKYLDLRDRNKLKDDKYMYAYDYLKVFDQAKFPDNILKLD